MQEAGHKKGFVSLLAPRVPNGITWVLGVAESSKNIGGSWGVQQCLLLDVFRASCTGNKGVPTLVGKLGEIMPPRYLKLTVLRGVIHSSAILRRENAAGRIAALATSDGAAKLYSFPSSRDSSGEG